MLNSIFGTGINKLFPTFLMSFSVAFVDLFILLTNLSALDKADFKGGDKSVA